MPHKLLNFIKIFFKKHFSASGRSLSNFVHIHAPAVALRRVSERLSESVEIVTFLHWSVGLTDPIFRPMANLSKESAVCRKTGDLVPIGLRGRQGPERPHSPGRQTTLCPVRRPTNNRFSL
jgi:hypothetical protein